MANIDVAYLTKDCIDEDGRLNYERIKFPKTARMKFNAKAQAIVDRYNDVIRRTGMTRSWNPPIGNTSHKGVFY